MAIKIHPTAIIDSNAQLANGVEVGAYSIIGPNVVLGENCWVGNHVNLTGHSTFGKNNKIYHFCSLGEIPQDRKYAGELTKLSVGDNNTIREYCTFNIGTSVEVGGHGITTIGSNNLIMAYSHIAHDCIVGDHTVFSNGATLAGHVVIDDWVVLGGLVAVHQFCIIGKHAMVAGYSAIFKDVPPYVMASGARAEPKGINIEGLKRRGFSSDQIEHIKQAYRLLYRDNLSLDEAKELITEYATTQSELQAFTEFFSNSTRSISVNMLKIAMIAGEDSGDMLAANLIKQIRHQYSGPIEFVGIGGQMMSKEGFISWHNMETLSIMGYIDVIKSLPKLIRLRYTILHQLLDYKPDVFIGIDAPDFNFFLENKLKQHQIKTVHYISPAIWAWRYSRIHKIKQSTDLMLCIFPFEEKIYTKEKIPAKFVGHPIAQQIEMNIDTEKYRQKLDLPSDKNIFCILVGSRSSEIKALATILIESCSLINQKIPNSLFIFPSGNSKINDLLKKYLERQCVDFAYQVILNQTRDAIAASDIVMAKSGTVSLEVALLKKPMLICYKVNKLTGLIVKHKLKTKYVGQPNIIAGREIAKEFLQDAVNPSNLSKYIIKLFNNHKHQQQMIDDFHQLHQQLIQDNGTNAAHAILDLVKQ